MRYILTVAALALALGTGAQNLEAKKNIEKLCGCFEVEFKYAETFAPDTAYKFHAREAISAGIELALPIEVSDKKISIQHLLVISDRVIVKHWREDWVYEPTTLWKYKGDAVWVKEAVSPESVKGKWVQTVWEVSDAPRYQGASDWVSTDNKLFWENTADAPLPRREYSVRNDYNILRRTNRIVLTPVGYTHIQDNQKIIRKEGADKLLAEEKGLNTYKHTAEKDCDPARLYWEKNKEYWSKVRAAWENYIATHNTIALKEKVDGKVLHEYLNGLANEYSAKKIKQTDLDDTLKAALEKYLDAGKTVAVK
jgi:hypothetical protein